MFPIADMTPFLVGVAVLLTMFAIRWRSVSRSEKRLLQLQRAADRLREHANYMEEFLGHEDAPRAIKALLIDFSDVLSDERSTRMLASRIINSFGRPPAATPEARALIEEMNRLRAVRPGLAETFQRAVGTGVVGAFLRWQGCSTALETIAPEWLADPDREFAAITTEGARLRNGIGFGFTEAPAIA